MDENRIKVDWNMELSEIGNPWLRRLCLIIIFPVGVPAVIIAYALLGIGDGVDEAINYVYGMWKDNAGRI